MKTFLDNVIEKLNHDYENLSSLHIILPSKRSCLYFTDRLIHSGYRSAWLPKIETLNDFIENSYPGRIANKLTLISILYRITKDMQLKEAESFDSFYKWGTVLLNDFNTINAYGIKGDDLYKNLRDIEVLERWSFSAEDWSKNQELFNDFWMKQGDIYKKFIQKLNKNNMASGAMALRWLLNHKNEVEKNYSNSSLIFAGFNALQKAEQELIHFLTSITDCQFLPDNDEFFIKGRREAGYFYRQLANKYQWNGLNEVENTFSKTKKEVDIISVNQRSSLGLVNSQILKHKENFDNTCVVLGDETLLESVLTSLPEEVSTVNVTMGYKLRNTPAYDLFVALYGLQLRMKKKSNELYHKDLLRFLNHPYLILFLGEKWIRKIKAKIVDQNLIYINRAQLGEVDPNEKRLKFLENLFKSWKNFPMDPTHILTYLIDEVNASVDQEKHSLIVEYLFHLHSATLQLNNHLEKHPIELNLKSYKTLFTEIVNSENLSFQGEPLEGLQIMGLLESRALDFEHVILLSMNEGTIPKTTLSQTFIPWDLRFYYGMPGRKEQDALYSYYFFRLINRAKKVSIVYNTNSGKDLSSAEPSRYIKQLHYYQNQGLIDFTIKEYQAKLNFSPDPTIDLSIKRDAFYHQKLKEKLASGLSPTALSSYLNCPLDFYFKYILKLKEGEEVDEEIGADVFGTIIHTTLEELYKPYIGKTPDFIEIRKNLKAEQKKAVKNELKNRWIKTGINRMNIQIIETLLIKFIELDERFVQKSIANGIDFTLEKIEDKLSRSLSLSIGGEKIEVNLRGLADRIDRVGDKVRIIDYKTGKVDKLFNVEIQKTFQDSKLSKPMQLLMYQAMYDDFESTDVEVGIVGFRELSKYLQIVKLKKGQDDVKAEFYSGLSKLIETMFFDENNIEHNPDSTWCTFCEMH